ncbi:DUF4270 domain-containing protein [Porphyromonas circumdentaria]|uniref:DUF4270 domain-containing protein n=1 Tax=Porphyromonas circumdentaria TaxID=29524 RepID=A0A1T4MP85_9PORP|nr:DUF4270 domain-containing protein [Porphyromonas circumdentaria]MBB6275900.1 hypothetical protein [Porphyromonas circumdentaria]MDO4722652.1 DUF4270 domain-containing protein [Porphyromonas circumdentaria]SJZ68920.1 protein of unknown function [Porphyromonas circumdentaria]
MKTNLFKPLLTLISIGVSLLFAACNDRLSDVGLSLPSDQHIQTQSDTLLLSAKTIAVDSIYSRSTYTLLGQLSDPFFGNFRSSYITRLQHAPGFKLKHTPINGKIDSVALEVSYASWVGDSTTWAKVAVYEVKQPLPESRYSRDLTPYIKDAQLLGTHTYQAGNAKGYHTLKIPLDRELGERIHNASINSPISFDTQQNFEGQILRGLYVRSTTGSGCMLSVYNTTLVLYYTYRYEGPNQAGRDTVMNVVGTSRFTNTNQLYMLQQFENSNIDNLLVPNNDYAYVKSPQGVAMQLSLSAEDLQKAFGATLGDASRTRVINDAQLKLPVNVPSETQTVLNPPAYTLLIPKDSINSFFQNGYTELTHPDVSYLSTQYNINQRAYVFNNISSLITKHLELHSTRDANTGSIKLNAPLEIVILPVRRETLSGSKITANIMNYVFPSGARIQLESGGIRMGVISSSHKTYKRDR